MFSKQIGHSSSSAAGAASLSSSFDAGSMEKPGEQAPDSVCGERKERKKIDTVGLEGLNQTAKHSEESQTLYHVLIHSIRTCQGLPHIADIGRDRIVGLNNNKN